MVEAMAELELCIAKRKLVSCLLLLDDDSNFKRKVITGVA
jgi:hypothetical protein